MRRPKFLIFAAIAVILNIAASTSFAQSTNRDRPTPLNSSDISGSFGAQSNGNKENFYSFTAGPGEVTITLDVKARRRDDSGGVTFELLQGNGSSTNQLICCEGAQLGEGGTGRDVASVKLTRRQTVILHLTNAFYNEDGGLFTVRIAGATSLGGGAPFGGTSPAGGIYDGRNDNRNDNAPVRRNRDDQLEVPPSGILHIRMKNGTMQDINLSRVRSITIGQ